jgi:hypothetical protein
MQRINSGKGTLKAFLSLAFIAAVIFACVRIIPVYVNNYQFQDYIQSQTPYWLTQHATAEAIRKNILAKAQDLNLPVTEDNVTLDVSGVRVSVNVDYVVPVNLVVCTLPLHFTPSSENRSI